MNCKANLKRIVKKCNETQRIAMKCSAILQRNVKQVSEHPFDHAKKRKATQRNAKKLCKETQRNAKKCKARLGIFFDNILFEIKLLSTAISKMALGVAPF